jgi:hypothetical protein
MDPRQCLRWVKRRKARGEHIVSASSQKADVACGCPALGTSNTDSALAAGQRLAACLDGTAPFPRLRRLNLPQNPDKTLYIRQLENGLERPGAGSRPTPGRLAYLVEINAFT